MQFQGWQVHVERVDGPEEAIPMVLLHGFGSGSFTWRPAIEAGLADGRRAIAFDRFGFGASERPRRGTWSDDAENPYSLTAAVELTGAVVDDLRAERVVLVGHSAGALVAAAYAATMTSTSIEALVLVAPVIAASGPPPPVAAAFKLPGARTWAAPMLRAGRPFVGRAVAASAWHDRRAFATQSVLRRAYDDAARATGWAEGLVELTLATIDAPNDFDIDPLRANDIRTLVVAGAHDRIAKPAGTARVAAATNARLVTIEQAGHVPHEERPNEFVEAVRDFLRAD